eukprot:COSAG06_NODE_18_length_34640_cov_31.179989_7_plen_100_part_00
MLARSCGRGYVPGNEGSPRRMVQYMLLLVACVGSMRQQRNSTWALESSTTPPRRARARARGRRAPRRPPARMRIGRAARRGGSRWQSSAPGPTRRSPSG